MFLNSLYLDSTNAFISFLNRSSENDSAHFRQVAYSKGVSPKDSNFFTASIILSGVCSSLIPQHYYKIFFLST